MLLAVPPLYAAQAPGWHSVPRASLFAVAALAALPHAWLSLLLTRRPTDGFTRAVGLGIVGATRCALIGIALYPVGAILTLLGVGLLLFPLVALVQRTGGGFGSLGDMIVWGVALFALQWMLARALVRLPAASRGSRTWLGASVGPVALVTLIAVGLALTNYAGSAAAREYSEPVLVPRARAMAAAARVVKELHRCAQLYATAHGGTYPDSLPGLWADEPRCRAAAFSFARSQGIELRYHPYHADGAAPAVGFDFVARADSAHDERRYALLTNETAIDLTPADDARWPAAAEWPDSTVVLHPATEMAQLILDEAERVNRLCWDPGRSGYPTDPVTAAQASSGPGCSFSPSSAILPMSVYDLKYVPADTTGKWARGFAISARPRSYGYDGFRSYLLEFRGLARVGIHATAADRAATPSDPVAPPCETTHGGACVLRP